MGIDVALAVAEAWRRPCSGRRAGATGTSWLTLERTSAWARPSATTTALDFGARAR